MAESLRSQFEHLFDKFRRLGARPIFYRAESRSQFGVSAESIRHDLFIIGPSGGVTDAPARKEVKAARAILGSSHSSRCIMLGCDSAARTIVREASWEGFAIWRRVGRLFLDGRNFSSRPVHFRPGRKVSNHPHHVVILSSAPIMWRVAKIHRVADPGPSVGGPRRGGAGRSGTGRRGGARRGGAKRGGAGRDGARRY